MTDDEHKAMELLALEQANRLTAAGKFPVGQPAGMLVLRIFIKGTDPLECQKNARELGKGMIEDIKTMMEEHNLLISIDQLDMAMLSQDADNPSSSIEDIVKQAKGMAEVVGEMAGISGESVLDDFRQFLEDAAKEYTLDAYLDQLLEELNQPIYPKGKNT